VSLIDLLTKYWELIGKKVTSPEFVPHPIIEAFMIATKSAHDKGEDGNYMGMSGDASVMPDKKPRILVSVIVNKSKDDITILEINDLNKKAVIPFSTAEKIIRSELMIEAFATQEIPVKDAGEIIAETIDTRVRILYDRSEIMKAVEFTQHRIRAGEIENIDAETIREILRLKEVSDWNKLSSRPRSLIGFVWGTRTGNNLTITVLEPTITKWTLRQTIMRILGV
jgi:hypothetical protein